jgi:AAA15 family ATPase/GTPase
MLREIKIENYKSILDDTIELGRINVFIGANGSGKTNILEALAMVAASKDNDLNVEGLYNRGVRVTKPSLTFSSFIANKTKDRIKVSLFSVVENYQIQNGNDLKAENYLTPVKSEFYTDNKNDIYSNWKDKEAMDFDQKLVESVYEELSQFISNEKNIRSSSHSEDKYEDNNSQLGTAQTTHAGEVAGLFDALRAKIEFELLPAVRSAARAKWYEDIASFLIYTLSTQALRGIVSESKKQPLGINGEGLDILLANFNEAESERITQYNYLISWIDELVLDEKDVLKYKGHKLGRSTSILYFKDKFMRKNNNVFSAENANEGALHILFYLALFISKKTPQLFAIDNIETALNPRVCRTLVKELAQLAKENNKQALITTHNPAILDGLNLNDDEQRLFVVYRTDEGHTKTKRIKLKPETKEGNLKLSELWMRGHLGGIPNDF